MKRFIPVLILLALFVFFLTPARGGQHLLRILYVNDFHGFAEPYKPLGSDKLQGGIAYLAGEVGRLRAERPSLLLAAGDMIQGNNWTNFFKGESAIEVMNAMRFDAMVVGNHEFDFGKDVLRKRIAEAKFPVLGANVEGLGLLKPYVVKEIDGLRVGIIGVVTEDTPVATHPRNIAGLKFVSPSESVLRYVGELKGRVDVIIVLSHIGYAADRALAGSVKGIDVIVGGHSHTKLDRPVTVGDTIIVQAWEHAKALGVLDLSVEDGKVAGFTGRLDEIFPSSGKEDKTVMAIVDRYENKTDAVFGEVIGTAGVDLDGENVRKRETNLGDLIADIMRQMSGADAAIINGGGIRTSIHRGPIRVKDVYSVLPFDNYVVAVKLTGARLRQALEHGVSAVEQGEGRFPQVSGIAFSFDPSAPAGSRVREIAVEGRPLDAGREYSVATNDFLAAGGDGYKVFGDAVRESKDFVVVGGMMKGEKLLYNDSGRWLRDMVIEYIKEHEMIEPAVEGRIKDVR